MTVEETVVQKLKEKNMVLTTAESCTGGWIAKRITDVSGASDVFECGIVSYANRIKHGVLGVSQETLDTFGAVSEQTAKEMAEGARRFAKADVAVSVTGIAGPNSDGTDKPVGLVYIAVATEKNTVVKKLLHDFKENVREQNRMAAANAALDFVLEVLKNE